MFKFDPPLFLKEYLSTGLGWVIFILLALGTVLLMYGLMGKMNIWRFTFNAGRSKVKRNMALKTGGVCLSLALIGIFFHHPKFTTTEYGKGMTAEHPFVGTWLILPSPFNQQKPDYTLVFFPSDDFIKGTIYRDDGKEYGFLRKVKPHPVLPIRASGNLGMNDGRKLSFKAEIQPDGKTLVVEYIERETKKVLGLFELKKIE